MKRVLKIVFLSALFTLMFSAFAPLLAQVIGGNAVPLQYSLHTYSAIMTNAAYTPVWGLYASGIDGTAIEGGAPSLVPGTDFTIVGQGITAGNAWVQIRFSFNNTALAVGNYVVGYKETTVDGNLCQTAVVLPITLYETFDLDVTNASLAEDCPDDANVSTLVQDIDAHIFQTTVVFSVFMNYPSGALSYMGTGGTWSFDFTVDADGVGAGANATISSIVATGYAGETWTPNAGSSNYTANCVVHPSNATPLTFTVIFNDVLGVEQDIKFSISAIKGPFSDRDIDEIPPLPANGGGNIISYKILAMPAAGEITALN